MTFRLHLLGGVSLESDAGPVVGAVAQRRRLALLALLAASPTGAVSRERLATFLFPDADAARAHKALADALDAIRRVLGKDAVVAAGDELRLNPDVVASDVAAFAAALAVGDHERAASLYRGPFLDGRGPFLDGFYVADTAELERWAESERTRLGRTYADAVEVLAAGCAARGDAAGAARWWRTRAAHDPLDSRTAMRLVASLAASGDPAGALRHAAAHRALLRGEMGIEPPAEFAALEEQVRARSVVRGPAVERAPAAASAPGATADREGDTLFFGSGAPRPRRPGRAPVLPRS